MGHVDNPAGASGLRELLCPLIKEHICFRGSEEGSVAGTDEEKNRASSEI